MTTQNIILFISFFVVAIVTVVVVFTNRKKTQNRRTRMQEPVFNENNYNNKNPYYYDENLEQSAKQANGFIDLVVEGDHYVAKYGMKEPTVAPSKYENYSKITTSKTEVIEKEEELATAEKEVPFGDEVDRAEILRAEKFFPNDLISLMLLALPEKPFVGYELLQALLSAGLRFGKMNIFHRFEQLNVKGGIMFSLASAVKPGTFEMAKMGAFSSPALVLFMRVSVQKEPMMAFDAMLTTARQLIDDMGGEVCDAQREILTEEKIAEIRATIAECEKTCGTSELFV